MDNKNGLLEGVVVLDLTRVLAGPYCGALMADMGATVIKVENPKGGDDSRSMGPFINDNSVYYANFNRSKMGCTLNLKEPEAKEIFKEMVKKADVVLENYRPGTMEKLGLGYDVLKEINPAIIYGAVSGFGHYGPYSKRAGYDIIGQAMSGLMSTTGWPDTPPTRTGTAISDVMGGISCCVGVLAAYINRLKTGEGEKVDVALVDSMVSALEIINIIYLCTGRVPSRIGNRYEAIYPYDSFKAKDGHVIIACGNNKLFELLVGVMNKPELLENPHFADNNERVLNHAELKPIIEEWLKDKTIDETVDMLLAVGIPAGPINTIDRVVADPHIAGAREMFVELEHPKAGKMKVTGNQIKFTNKKVKIDRPAPLLGQHNEEILGEKLGYTPEQVAQLKEDGVL